MAQTIIFDKLSYLKKLEQAGVKHEQAEAFAEALGEALREGSSELTTKKDLLELKTELIKWVVGLLFAQTAVIVSIVGLMKFLN